MTTTIHLNYGLASTLTDPATGLSGPKGVVNTRVTLPLATIHYEIDIAFDGSGDVATIDLNDGTSSGAVIGVQSTGAIDISANPSVNETVEANSITYTFKAAAAADDEITIGVDATETGVNTAAAINANDPAINAVSVTGYVVVSAAYTGEYGDAITLAESATNVVVTGATLTGGADQVTFTGDGVDYLGTALPVAAAIHALLVQCSIGSVVAEVAGVLLDTVTPHGGLQVWNRVGRTDLLANLTITSGAAGTRAKVIVAASE